MAGGQAWRVEVYDGFFRLSGELYCLCALHGKQHGGDARSPEWKVFRKTGIWCGGKSAVGIVVRGRGMSGWCLRGSFDRCDRGLPLRGTLPDRQSADVRIGKYPLCADRGCRRRRISVYGSTKRWDNGAVWLREQGLRSAVCLSRWQECSEARCREKYFPKHDIQASCLLW